MLLQFLRHDRGTVSFHVFLVKRLCRPELLTESVFIYQNLVETAKTFHSEGNFLAEEIQTRVAHTINRSVPADELGEVCSIVSLGATREHGC